MIVSQHLESQRWGHRYLEHSYFIVRDVISVVIYFMLAQILLLDLSIFLPRRFYSELEYLILDILFFNMKLLWLVLKSSILDWLLFLQWSGSSRFLARRVCSWPFASWAESSTWLGGVVHFEFKLISELKIKGAMKLWKLKN